MTWTIVAIGYSIGAVGTFAYNMHDMVYVTSWLRIIRNALLWPIFLPILIALKEKP